ncbi:MAG: hypothetical protein NPINA01_09390 [Nitrospinaceae bacterium]|nr:MAG: hypothetical protein NPINA01_09390 [Nitrospinaceae bacterium]
MSFIFCLFWPYSGFSQETADGFLAQGVAFSKEGEHEKAIPSFKRALELDPTLEGVRLNLGIAYFKLQSFEEAAETFQQILERNPENSSALVFLGLSLQGQEQYEKSIPYFEKAGKLDPDFHQLALFNIGKAHSQLGNFEQSAEHWNKAIKADPGSELAEGAKALLKLQADKKPQKPWHLSFGAGFEYDDNITVDEQDLTTNLDDFSYIFEFSGAYKFLKTPKLELEAGYDFYQSLHDDLAAFDIQSHIFSLSGSHELGKFNLGLFNFYNRTTLGEKDFLEILSASPSVGYAVSEKWYATLTYAYKDTHFFDSPLRDAQNHGFSFGNFFFIMDGKGIIQLSYRFENEITTGEEFDYLGHYVNSQVKLPLGKKTKIILGHKYIFRDYKNVTVSIGEKRDDFRHTIEFGVAQTIYKNVFGKLDYQFIDSTSNLASSDYKENIASLTLGVSF